MSILDFLNTYLFGPGLSLAVFFCGIYFLFTLSGHFFTSPKRFFSSFRSGIEETSPLRAMVVALAGTLGVGNIVGVASAIAIGGAGAVFWMWMSAIAAMPIKYAEIVLAVKHRRYHSGRYHGGAYYYMEDGKGKYSKLFAILFAVLCLAASLIMGCAVQANAISVSLQNTFSLSPIVCALILSSLLFLSISGGLSRISTLLMQLIPLMSGIYLILTALILFSHASLLGSITREIFTSALQLHSIGGGIMGFFTSRALRLGVTRGIVSNEAGCGTAPIAHAGANVKSPAAQGVWGMLEVFIDTIVICTLSAYVVLIAERCGVPLLPDGMTTASHALNCFFSFADPFLCVAVFVFAFCTMLCWFHYGTESLAYFTSNPLIQHLYLAGYVLFALFGCLLSGNIVWSLSDFIISAMAALNIVTVMLHAKEIQRETANYFCKKQYKFYH